MVETLTLETWIGIAVAVIAFWGIATWALIRTMRQEDRKLKLIERQGQIDTYSPSALSDLREWIRENPNDPYVDDAIAAYNECVETLRTIDEPFYSWSQSEIERLELIE